MTEDGKRPRDVVEELKVAGGEIVAQVKRLIQEGNVRRIVVEKESGEKVLEIPVTLGAGVGAAAALMAPVLAGLGAAALLLSRARIKVIRDQPPGEELQKTDGGGAGDQGDHGERP